MYQLPEPQLNFATLIYGIVSVVVVFGGVLIVLWIQKKLNKWYRDD